VGSCEMAGHHRGQYFIERCTGDAHIGCTIRQNHVRVEPFHEFRFKGNDFIRKGLCFRPVDVTADLVHVIFNQLAVGCVIAVVQIVY